MNIFRTLRGIALCGVAWLSTFTSASAQLENLEERSFVTVACKTQALADRFVALYYSESKPGAQEVVEQLKTQEEPRPCFYGSMSLTIPIGDLLQLQPLSRRDIPGNREAQVLKVTVNGRWTGRVYWPQVPMERYILHLVLKR